MVKGFNMIDNLPTEAYRYKLKNPLLDYKYRFGVVANLEMVV